ncbi:hypothetical protein CEUSTIGMA_g5175.t1 [Chlamydomonas eustigma]|uniref:Uncharacterized protein n=1 Tax=Chlamydomonas eustigma TaxID=1157962 RepID=A0A250X4B7_9CHLO|nr:hypothetical protein CEUSTIGMA_g5175.t1 [Chlamydomonas eustigma]|eukprot:GAX77732.1 hypothetical protein CEUSTIGMA_g5175.t1 [Chlamydomonas eustigma]
MEGYNYNSILNSDLLVSEVSSGTFCFKNKIKAGTVKLLWDKLAFFIADTLKSQKGVLLPNLGSFRVGPVIGENRKKIRVQFALLDGRYGAVSQERSKYNIGGKAPIVQPNYGVLSASAAVHRGTGQRLVAELLQRLGIHILSSRAVRVEFPGLGRLVTNRAGRIEFVFDSILLEHFERELYAVVKEMDYSPEDFLIQKGLQAVHLDNPPMLKSPVSRPVSALRGVNKAEPTVPGNVHAPYKEGLLAVLKLCRASDRTQSGSIPRLRLEQWLHQECRPLLLALDGATLFTLLDKNSLGSTSKQIMYKSFLNALEAALATATAKQATGMTEQAWQHTSPEFMEGGGECAQKIEKEMSAADLVSQPVAEVDEPDADQYLHYCQNQLSPRSRADYDAFNRAHFERLYSAQGRAGRRAVTPKVGEEPLNLQEYQAVRAATPLRSPPDVSRAKERDVQRNLAPQAWAAAVDPPRAYVHSPQVLKILHPSPQDKHHTTPTSHHKPRTPSAFYQQQGYDILAPPPPLPGNYKLKDVIEKMPVVSQYDISRESDPDTKAQLKAQYAAALTEGWSKQIQEKSELEDVLIQKEKAWPFAPTGVPMDKRPVSAISRPQTSPRRLYSGLRLKRDKEHSQRGLSRYFFPLSPYRPPDEWQEPSTEWQFRYLSVNSPSTITLTVAVHPGNGRALVHVVEGMSEEEPNSAFVLGLQVDRYFPVEISRQTSTSWSSVVANEEAFFTQMEDHIVKPLNLALGSAPAGQSDEKRSKEDWPQAFSVTNPTLMLSVLAVVTAVVYMSISRSSRT